MHRHDVIRLRHMMDAAKEALSFIKAKNRADLDQDRMLVLSLVKSIEIIGEAASRVSPKAQAEYAALPWNDMVAMRNRLIHG